MEQMGGDSALPEETNYQDFGSKTNILQSNHILQSLLHCSVCMCVCVYCISDKDLDQLTCGGRDWISSRGIIQELLEPIFLLQLAFVHDRAIIAVVEKC